MALIYWKDEMVVGVKDFDEQHKKLVNLVNKLYETIKSGGDKDQKQKLVEQLKTYAKTHFTLEERMMSAFGYPDYEKHKIEHARFLAKIKEIRKELHNEEGPLNQEVLYLLRDWLYEHITKTDKKYNSFFHTKGLV